MCSSATRWFPSITRCSRCSLITPWRAHTRAMSARCRRGASRPPTWSTSHGRATSPTRRPLAPIALVRDQVEKKSAKLLAGVSRDTFSIGSRVKVELRDVELIVKDLIRKQQLVCKHDSRLGPNTIIGLLRDDRSTSDADAAGAHITRKVDVLERLLHTSRVSAGPPT